QRDGTCDMRSLPETRSRGKIPGGRARPRLWNRARGSKGNDFQETAMNRYLVPASLLAALIAAPLAFATPDGDQGSAPAGANPPAAGNPVGGRFGGRRARLGAHRMGRFLKALGVTDAQRAELQKSREATKSVREDLFAKLKAIREDAKAEAAKGARTDPMRDATREKVKAAITAAREQVAPEARRLMGL